MIFRWVFYFFVLLPLRLFGIFFSWLLAFFAVTRDEHKYCLVKGPRQYLWGFLHLWSTHDDGVDAPWWNKHYDDRMGAAQAEAARGGGLKGLFFRWWMRTKWLVRNQCYGFSYYLLGFDRSSGFTTNVISQKGVWDSDTTNWLIRVDTTTGGVKAFQVQAQLFFYKNRFLRVNLGWKLTWDTQICQLATHINPFRTWD